MGGIDVFDCGNSTLRPPRGESSVYTLEQLNDRQSWQSLIQSINRFSIASFCLEMSDALTAEGDPEGGTLFRPLYFTLRAIERSDEPQALLSVGCYFVLDSLRHSGFNVLNELEESDSCVWFRHMLIQNQPVIAQEANTIREGTIALLNFSERMLEKQLSSAHEIRKMTGKLNGA